MRHVQPWVVAPPRDVVRCFTTRNDCADRAAHALQVARLLTPLEKLALCVAAVSHDAGHDGVNNVFLCATNSELAHRYNDLSPSS